jgi:hypothetical protein
MNTVTVRVPAQNRNFTSLSRVKQEFVSASGTDGLLQRYISDATNAIVAFTDREFVREGVTEQLVGSGLPTAMITRRPVAALDAVRGGYIGIQPAVTVSGVQVRDRNAGILYLNSRFNDNRRYGDYITRFLTPAEGYQGWEADYTGGYLVADDNVLASGISLVAEDRSIRWPGGLWPMLVAGDRVRLSGFSGTRNNGVWTVTRRVDDETLTVLQPLTNEGPTDQEVSVEVANLPATIEMACIEMVKYRYKNRNKDTSLSGEKIGDYSYTRGKATPGVMPMYICEMLESWEVVE